jgi:pectinesterase inhibitor-like protein
MAAGSSSCSPVLLLLLLLLASAGAGAGEASTSTSAPALDQVCGRLGSYYVTPSLCFSALCADASSPCRAARDAPAVAALAARLVADNATAARDSIEAVFSPSSSSTSSATAAAAAARSCLQLYAGAVPALRWAARAVAAGRYRGAREVLQAAQYVAAGCDGIAGDAAAALPRENDGFADMAFVAHAVVASMSAD